MASNKTLRTSNLPEDSAASSRLVALMENARTVATASLLMLVDHPSPPKPFEELATQLKEIVVAGLDARSQAILALNAASSCSRSFSVGQDERDLAVEALLQLSLHLHPTVAGHNGALSRLILSSSFTVSWDGLVASVAGQGQAQWMQASFVESLRPHWTGMIEIGAACAESGYGDWSGDDLRLVIKAIRGHYALSSCDTSNPRSSRQHGQDLLHSFSTVGLPLWKRLHAVLIERLDFRREAEPLWTSKRQGALYLYLQSRFGNPWALSAPVLSRESEPQAPTHDVATVPVGMRVVIRGPIHPSNNREDKDELKRFEPLTQPVAVVPMPSPARVDEIITEMHGEFPWAENLIDEVGRLLRVRALFGSQELALPPLLLAGPPGSGKTRFARRLADRFKLPFLPVSVGGSHDAKALVGTSRGWSTACASPLLKPLLAHRTASALILLDEIDKASANGEGSPAITSALLTFLEPETAARYEDLFLQATCDLSRLVFVATANSLAMPKPLLSRFHVMYMPAPRSQDWGTIAREMLVDMAKDLGVSHEALPAPPADLIHVVGGNARALRFALWRYLHDWAQVNLRRERLH